MYKAKLTKLKNKLVLVVKEDALFELTYCTKPDSPEDCKTDIKTWDMCSEQEHNVIFGQAVKEYVQEQEMLLDTVIQPDTNEDRETVSEDTPADEK